MNRRRRYDDSNEDRNFNKRRRTSSYTQEIKEEDPIKATIYTVGDRGTRTKESIEVTVTNLETNLATQKAKILQTLVEVVTTFPDKFSVYSTIAGLLNAKNYNFGGEFVENLVKSFKEFLKAGNWRNCQYTVRFISDLVNCHVVSATSLLQLYDTFMEGAIDPAVPQVRRDWLVYVILYCLPCVGRELYEKKEQTVERLMITIDNYMKKRKKTHVGMLRVWASDEPHPQEEYLDCLWAQVEKFKLDGWAEKHISRPYMLFDNILCEALQHNLQQITLPPHHEGMRYPIPSVVFRMFDYTDCPEGPNAPLLPGAHSIERFLIEEELRDILRKFHLERKECAIALLQYPHHGQIPQEYMIIEVIFGELFRLPTPEYLEICYGSILIELCKSQPGTIPQILALTAGLLFNRLDTMNVTCIDRFANWFSYHLSNFQFRWTWEDWMYALNSEPEHPKPKFINEVLQKCIRLSYYERIVENLPQEFEGLFPTKSTEPLYKYFESDKEEKNIVGWMQSKQLQAAFRGKAAPDEIAVIMREVPNPLDDDEATHNPIAIDIFSQTIFMLGSKSISHCQTAIAKYQSVFKELVPNEDAQLCVLKAAYDVWKNDTQMLSVVSELLLKYHVIECASVANWVFMKEMTGEFTRIYLWEILHMTIKKMNKHVAKLSGELNEARDKLCKAEMNSSESEGEDDKKEKDLKDVPTEEQVDKMEERLESAQADQKNLFLIVFQRFIMILSEHITRCDTDGKSFNTPWFRWTIGRLQQVFAQHADQVAQYSSTLETLLFTQDLDRNILETFQQFQALKA